MRYIGRIQKEEYYHIRITGTKENKERAFEVLMKYQEKETICLENEEYIFKESKLIDMLNDYGIEYTLKEKK